MSKTRPATIGTPFMTLPPLDNGYWHVNIAPLGETPIEDDKLAPPHAPVEDDKLFGYAREVLMRKQYR